MGQPITVTSTRVGDTLLIDADRSLTGQDGSSFDREQAAGGSDFPAHLAQRLFELDPAVDHVYVGSNGVVVRRSGGWDDAAAAGAEARVRNFFVFYEQNRA